MLSPSARPPASLGGANVAGYRNIPYAAGNFTGSGSIVWTVEAIDLLYFRFAIVGSIARFQLAIAGSDISGTGAVLQVALPVTVTAGLNGLGYISDTAGRSMATCSVSGSTLAITRFDQANFATGVLSLVVEIETPLGTVS